MIRIVGTSTIDIRNAEFGDILRFNHNAIIRHTRVGELKHYSDSNWPKVTFLAFTITRLTKSEMQDFRDLMVSDAGLEFTISRREGVTVVWTYTGYILTPTFDIIRVRPPCSYDLNFDFQVKVA